MQDRRPPAPALHASLSAVLGAAFFCVSATPALAAPGVRQTPDARQTYVISDFDTIRLEAPVEVVITSGKGASASGTGDRATLDALNLQMGGRTLIIRMNRPALGSQSAASGRARLLLATGELRRATLLGSGSLTADRMKGNNAEASLRGSGTMKLSRIEADRLTVGLIGAGTMTLGGRASDVTATVSGSARLDAAALDARRLRVDAEGSVDVRFAARESVTAVATGSSRAIITGTAACTVRKLGSATVECAGIAY
ncbi:MAG TPA: DUF2807 domain-containing protein [Sphingobium sp.]|nr:DUF2807 domain-containing protein [Sphingobium sp.]